MELFASRRIARTNVRRSHAVLTYASSSARKGKSKAFTFHSPYVAKLKIPLKTNGIVGFLFA